MIRKRLSACLVAICLAARSLDAVAYQPPAPYPPPEAATVLRGLGLIERHNLAWSADSSELLITLSTSFVASRDELPGINLPSAVTTFDLNHAAFIYNLDSGQTRLVQPSPFSLRLTDQEREHYQSGDNPVYTSPHVDSEITPVNIVYASTLGSYCGVECSNRIPMLGEYWPQDLDRGTYAPLDMRVSASGLRVIWSATSAFAVVESIADFGSFATIYHLDLGTGETEYVDLIDVTLDDVFAVSNDGRRILYSRTDFAEGLHRAITWEASQRDEACRCTRWAESIEIGIVEDDRFVGGAYIAGNQTQVLLVAGNGLRRYELETGSYEIVSPQLSSDWAELVVFSPDNRSAAIFSEGVLYVLPLDTG